MKRFKSSAFSCLSFFLLILFLGIPAELASIPSSAFVYPLLAPKVSSNYGKRRHPIRRVVRHHNGVDLAAPKDTPIRAVADGRVIFADSFSKYGNLVVISHSDGLSSHYGHCKKINVDIGDEVKAGQIIATVGSTGLSTGPHLHLEFRMNGEPRNPFDIMPGLKAAPRG